MEAFIYTSFFGAMIHAGYEGGELYTTRVGLKNTMLDINF